MVVTARSKGVQMNADKTFVPASKYLDTKQVVDVAAKDQKSTFISRLS